MPKMKAAVLHEPGGPERLTVEQVSIPDVHPGEVLIRVKAFGLNRSEMFTRQGHSPDVKLPRILGIEAVGIVENALGTELREGDTVVTCMGGMGRNFDGSYAEHVVIPAKQVLAIHTTLPWAVLGALPEMLQTAWGALHTSLRLREGERLLIRGGTSSVGLAALSLARAAGAIVSATTRNPQRFDFLRDLGAAEVFLDDGEIADKVRHVYADGVDKILELVGTKTLLDSLECCRKGGVVCATGIIGNEWSLHDFNPSVAIPTAVHLTTYGGTYDDLLRMPFQSLVSQTEVGDLHISLGRTFQLNDIADAHRFLDSGNALGKIVVLT